MVMNEEIINKRASDITRDLLRDNHTKTLSLSDKYDIHVIYEDANITMMLIKKPKNKVEKSRTVNVYEAEHIKTVVTEYLHISAEKKFLGLF